MLEIYDDRGELTKFGLLLKREMVKGEMVKAIKPLVTKYRYHSSELAYLMTDVAEEILADESLETNLKDSLSKTERTFLKEVEGCLEEIVKKYQIQLQTPVNKEDKPIEEIEF